ncbi:MAG: PAS domain-containing protein [Gemmatimonadetes bacterium]|nr:PAS domain-containing protein [Gemmatimonadota bacterium]
MARFDLGPFFELASNPLCVLDASARVVRANAAFASLLPAGAAGPEGRPLAELLLPEDRAAAGGELARLARDGGSGQFRTRTGADGGPVRLMDWTAVADPAHGLVALMGNDVTEQVAARQSSDLLTRLAQQVPGVIYQYRLHPDGRSCFPFASDAMEEIYEVTPAEVREDATPVFSRLHPDDFDGIVASIRRSAETLEPWRHDYRVVLPRQGVRWRTGHARPERLPDGSILWHGFITDSTAQQLAEQELRQKDAALASAITPIAMGDVRGRVTFCNQAFLTCWGFADASQVVGRQAVEFFADPDEALRVMRVLLQDGSWAGELDARRADGTTFLVQVGASRFTDRTGQPAGLLASFLDVTEARRLQQQFLQAQKMESVGRLAGGVAHDFNNLLTIMKGHLTLAGLELPPDSPVREDLTEIAAAVDSAAALTHQLLAFSRKQVINPRVLALGDVVTRVRGMLQRLLGEDIELRTVVAGDAGDVRFDPAQADQILINLAINARDAMANGGTLTVEVSNVELDVEYVQAHPGSGPGEYVVLAVSDTGHGLSDEVKAHLFEPFFTTKAVGSGTGLGLAMVHGAVSQNGGRIEVYSELGHGTTFRIFLPRVRDAVPEEFTAPASPDLAGHGEVIALVEDDSRVRGLAARLLERQGYVVHAFPDGGSAVAGIGALRGGLDLLITDVIMPGMNGRRLAEELLRRRPGLRILFTSGYTANVILQHGVLEEGVEFLAKPYSAQALAQRVRALLDAPRAGR